MSQYSKAIFSNDEKQQGMCTSKYVKQDDIELFDLEMM